MIEIETENQHHMILYTIGEVAKMLSLKDGDGKMVGRNRLFRLLRANKILCKDNTPNQYCINMGLAVLHKTTKKWKTYVVPTFTDKGIAYLQRGFGDGRFTKTFVNNKQDKCVTNIVNLNDVT